MDIKRRATSAQRLAEPTRRSCRARQATIFSATAFFQSGQFAGGTPLYPTQRHIAPRIAVAYSPQKDSGWLSRLSGGPGKSSIRAGFGMYYDEFGQSLIRLGRCHRIGFFTRLQNPGTQTASSVPRYTGLTTIPSGLLPAAPAGGFRRWRRMSSLPQPAG